MVVSGTSSIDVAGIVSQLMTIERCSANCAICGSQIRTQASAVARTVHAAPALRAVAVAA